MENLNTEDKTINCVDCNEQFVFTKNEQDFFKSKNLTEPKRCAKCRKLKKQQRMEPRNYNSRDYRG